MTLRTSPTIWCLLGRIAVVLCLVGAGSGGGSAAELVMFETKACPWCAAWQRDVGAIYHKTPEAETAPLRRVDLDTPRPADLEAVRRVVYTPTLVLMDQGREIGRIAGYPGADHFWGLLAGLLEKLAPASSQAQGG